MKIIYIVLAFILGMVIMDCIISSDIEKRISKMKSDANKLYLYYRIFNMWLDMKQNGISLGDYMKKQGYNRVAIYGMKELGERLYRELSAEGIEIVCVIDSNKYVLGDYVLICPDDEIPSVDLLIITADYYYSEIKERMITKVNCPIVSISGLIGDAFGRYI